MFPRSLGVVLAITAGVCVVAPPSASPLPPPPATTNAKPIFATPKTADDLQTLQEKVQALIPKARAATVAIGSNYGIGSGVIISADGYILTAGHVSYRANTDTWVFLESGKVLRAKTLGIFATMDAGLAKIEEPGGYPFLPMGKSADLKVGQWLLTLGHPGGYHSKRPSVPRLGRVLFNSSTLVGTDSPLVGGDSGGPLIDLEGNVVGINSHSGIPAIANTQVPVDIYRTTWNRLVKGEYWPEAAMTQPAILNDAHDYTFSPEFRKDTEVLRTTFGKIAPGAVKATVSISGQLPEGILGTIISADGYILTKASELTGKILVTMPDGRRVNAKLVNQSAEHDLALIKIDATNLTAVEWGTLGKPVEGTIVASPGGNGKIAAIGIVSLPARDLPQSPGLMGVHLGETPDGPQVLQVWPDSPARLAGIRPGDVITSAYGKLTAKTEDLVGVIRSLAPGTKVDLSLKRDGADVGVWVTLAEQLGPNANTYTLLRGAVSKRAAGFPSVLQHDCVLKPSECGGPLVDISGKAIGINIARAGRAESMAIPADVLPELIEKLKRKQSTTMP